MTNISTLFRRDGGDGSDGTVLPVVFISLGVVGGLVLVLLILRWAHNSHRKQYAKHGHKRAQVYRHPKPQAAQQPPPTHRSRATDLEQGYGGSQWADYGDIGLTRPSQAYTRGGFGDGEFGMTRPSQAHTRPSYGGEPPSYRSMPRSELPRTTHEHATRGQSRADGMTHAGSAARSGGSAARSGRSARSAHTHRTGPSGPSEPHGSRRGAPTAREYFGNR